MPNGNPFIQDWESGSSWDDFMSGWLGINPEDIESVVSTGWLNELAGNPFADWITGASGMAAEAQNYWALQNVAMDLSGYIQDNPLYQYQGIPSTIMDSLGGVFGELEGYEIGFDDIFGEEGFGDVPEELFEGFLPSNMFGYDVTDPESIAQALSAVHWGEDVAYDPSSHIRAAEVTALSPEMLQKTTSAYYDPYEATERKKITKRLEQDVGKVNPGGFAGSGSYTGGLAGAQRGYRTGYEGILEDIMGMKGQATDDVLDTIYGWQELLGDI